MMLSIAAVILAEKGRKHNTAVVSDVCLEKRCSQDGSDAVCNCDSHSLTCIRVYLDVPSSYADPDSATASW